MEKKKITIGITGLNNIDSPGPGIPVIRGIKESDAFDVRIVGLAYENLEPGIYMKDLVDKAYLVPYPSSGADEYLNRIFEIHAKENLDLIIPNFDAELYTFIKNSKKINEKGIATFLPTIEQFEERHKAKLPDFANKYNVNVPKSFTVLTTKDILNVEALIGYPFFVKGKFYEAYKVHNREQALFYFAKLEAKWGLPVVIQEMVSGTEVNVVALGDGEGNTVAAVPMRKTYITDKGKAWGGITIKDEKMLEITREIIAKTKWRGGMELEMIKTKDEKYYLIEINPRIPAWVYLAVGAGQNIPEALVKLALGFDVKPFDEYKVGKMFIRYSYDLIGDVSQFAQINIYGEL